MRLSAPGVCVFAVPYSRLATSMRSTYCVRIETVRVLQHIDEAAVALRAEHTVGCAAGQIQVDESDLAMRVFGQMARQIQRERGDAHAAAQTRECNRFTRARQRHGTDLAFRDVDDALEQFDRQRLDQGQTVEVGQRHDRAMQVDQQELRRTFDCGNYRQSRRRDRRRRYARAASPVRARSSSGFTRSDGRRRRR